MTGLRAAEAQTDPVIWKECKQSRLKKCTIRQTRRRKACAGRHRFVCPSGLNEPFQTASASVATDTLMRLAAFRTSAKVSLHRPDYCCSFTGRYSKLLLHSNPPPPPPLGDFHSSPITSSNDSNLSPRACGLSKNGRHMWEKSKAVAEIRRRAMSAPSVICKHANAA